MKTNLAVLVCALMSLPLLAGQTTPIPPGTNTVNINVVAPTPAAPAVTISLGNRHGHVSPLRCGFTHTGAGNVDVQQPTADTLVITMTGVAVAGGHPTKNSEATLSFDLQQCFEVAFDNPEKTKKAKMSIEGRVIGLLRSESKAGIAQEGPGSVSIASEAGAVVSLCVPAHSVTCHDSLSINDHEGPTEVPVVPGKYTLHETFVVSASHPRSLLPCKASSAEFAPDPALDPLWISYWEPFHGATKKDFAFQVTIKVSEDTGSVGEEKKPEDKGK
jgi:hypothetical protein